jgi:FkbM family methyltransferase
MIVLGREARYVGKALVSGRHYRALAGLCLRFPRPGRAIWNYVTRTGDFPADYRVRTPIGPLSLRLYSVDDLLTLNEIFARCDYKAEASDSIVVDIGSNIGLSIAYFLSRSKDVFVYAFEPVPMNVERLRNNLATFPDRYIAAEVAIANKAGRMTFGIEDTGRYGGLELDTGRSIQVDCVACNDIVDALLARYQFIDILKADIEGYEAAILKALRPEQLRRIRKLYVECSFERNPLPDTHSFRQYGNVAQFRLRRQLELH